MKKGAIEFRKMLERNHELAEHFDSPGFPGQQFTLLQDWQRNRLKQTYSDYMASTRDKAACHFFLHQLYGGMNFRDRNHDVARVAPVMIKMLPDKALRTLAEAFRLQAISLDLDIEMAEIMLAEKQAALCADEYGLIYRQCGRRADREHQIQLIQKLGYELNTLVAMPTMLKLLRLMHGPAIVAGFGKLQTFLEEGLSSFEKLTDPQAFVDDIFEREWAIMESLFAGK